MQLCNCFTLLLHTSNWTDGVRGVRSGISLCGTKRLPHLQHLRGQAKLPRAILRQRRRGTILLLLFVIVLFAQASDAGLCTHHKNVNFNFLSFSHFFLSFLFLSHRM